MKEGIAARFLSAFTCSQTAVPIGQASVPTTVGQNQENCHQLLLWDNLLMLEIPSLEETGRNILELAEDVFVKRAARSVPDVCFTQNNRPVTWRSRGRSRAARAGRGESGQCRDSGVGRVQLSLSLGVRS